MADHFGDSGGVGGDNRFPGRHRLQKYDAEAFLHAGKTKDVGTIVFHGELVDAYVADPGDEALDSKFAHHVAQARTFGPVADNSYIQFRLAAAKQRDSTQQYVQALAGVE